MGYLRNLLEMVILKRILAAIIQGAVSYAAAHAGVLHAWGITITIDPAAAFTASMAATEALRHALAEKYPDSKWL